MTYKKSTPRRPPKILYQFHHSDAQVFEVRALTLQDEIEQFHRSHRNTAIHQILLVGRHGQWVPVSPDVLEVAA